MKKYGKMRTWFFALALAAGMAAAGAGSARADEKIGNSVDEWHVIMLIDNTGSMQYPLDRNQPDSVIKKDLAVSAAQQFINQLQDTSSEQAAVTRLQVMSFNLETTPVTDMLALNDESSVETILDAIGDLEFKEKGVGGTNPYCAVCTAVDALEEQDNGTCKNMIVMLTDGAPERIGMAEHGDPYGLSEAEWEAKMEEAIGRARQMGAQIFAVGVNSPSASGGTALMGKGKQLIYSIANQAQQEEGIQEPDEDDTERDSEFEAVNYEITGDLGEIRRFYINVFGYMNNVTPEAFTEDFDIPNEGIIEADVIIISGSKILGLETISPSGTVMAPQDGVYSEQGDDYYRVLKIMYPECGTWGVQVDAEEDDYKKFVVRIYGLSLEMETGDGAGADFADCTMPDDYVGRVAVYPIYKNAVFTDQSFLDSVSRAEMIVTDQAGDLVGAFPLVHDDADGAFAGYFPVEEDGVFDVTAVIEAGKDGDLSQTLTLEGMQIHVPLYFNVDLAIDAATGYAADFPGNPLTADYLGKVIVTPRSRGAAYADPAFLADVTRAEMTVTDAQGASLGTYGLDWDAAEGAYTGYFPIEENDEFSVTATLEAGQGAEWSRTVTYGGLQSDMALFTGVTLDMAGEWGKSADLGAPGITEEYAGKVTVTPVYQGGPFADPAFAAAVTKAQITLEDEQGAAVGTYPLTEDAASGQWTAYFPLTQDGTYKVHAEMEAGPNSEWAQEASLDDLLVLLPVEIDLGEIRVKKGKEETIDTAPAILAAVPGMQGLSVSSASASPSSGTENASEVSSSGTQITVKGVKKGEDALEAVVTDGRGKVFTLTGTVRVDPAFPLWLIPAILAGVAAAAGLVVLAGKGRNAVRYVPGRFLVVLQDDSRPEVFIEGSPAYPRGRSFSLWTLVETVIRQAGELTDEEKELVTMIKKRRDAIAERMIVIQKPADVTRPETYHMVSAAEIKTLQVENKIYDEELFSIRVKFTPEKAKKRPAGR